MMRDALIALSAAAVLGSLVELALDLAGRPRRRTSRLRSASLLLSSTGVLSWQLLPASLPWPVSFISPLLVLAGVICTFIKAPKGKPSTAVHNGITRQSGT